ncbi:two-partner secretion domain-containing protein [Leptolyngbya iicbica]|uniref:Filamentous hemagglutinin N-terminal domain-containing protein n=1 Tax=Lyngbya confervoides BDU141951 TaxID=1574623 RepID=A0A0C1URT2_9CYAN
MTRAIAPLVSVGCIAILGLLVNRGEGQAQVIPDTTLSAESSIVNPVTLNGTTYTVTGGALRGGNLFHSFEQFSVPAGDTAAFANPDFVTNIISRVTGGTLSDLQGTIQAGGNANLFLINPAGVVIGPNARLDIGGSFLASTGNGLWFDNGFLYDVADPEVPPLLTISAPFGINLGTAPSDIAVVGQAGSPALAVAEGQTLALIGGEVWITGRELTAPGGRIAVGSVQEASRLNLTPDALGFDVSFDGVTDFGNIQLADRTLINASGIGGGAIALQGQSITLSGQSALISDTLGDRDGSGIQVMGDRVQFLDSSYIGAATLGSGAASNIDITANDIEIVGTGIANYKLLELATFLGTRQIRDRQISGITSTTVAPGRTGNITLNTQRLTLDEGVQISTESFGQGDSGDINISSTESLRVRGSGILAGSRVLGIPLLTPDATATGLTTSGIAAGGGGNIDISTARLSVENGGSIVTGTISDRDSGSVSIEATDSVFLGGSFAPFLFPTSITTVSIGGRGAAGDLDIKTGRLSLQDGSLIFADSGVRTLVGDIEFGGPAGNVIVRATEAVEVTGGQPLVALFGASAIRSRTFSDAPAGTIQITTPTLSVLNGGRISSATLSDGVGGAINIDTHNVIVAGAGNNDLDAISGIFANSGFAARVAFTTGEIEAVPASGTGGSISINTDKLAVQDTADITVGSFGSGAAGNLDITAGAVRLDRGGSLTATTTADGGGNISLTANTLALDSSRITASSDRGDGGNLTFNLQDVLLLRNGSLISTEAGTAGAGGNGGDITLNLPNGFIVAVPSENSDIRANAFEGQGGNVNVTALSLLGIAFRPNVLDTPLSDITASSRFGSSGTVIINELAPDITPEDAALDTELAPPALVPGCRAPGSQTGSFVITGRGGLPTHPVTPLGSEAIWQDLAPITLLENGETRGAIAPSTTPPPVTPLVEAQQAIRTENGELLLVAEVPTTPDSLTSAVTCAADIDSSL